MDVVDRCPGCGASSQIRASRQAPGFETDAGGLAFSQPSYEVRQCSICMLYFKTQIWSEAEENQYYRLLDYRKWESKTLFPTESAILEIARKLPSGSRVLDFGCSSGRLLDAMGERLRRHGVEVNQEAADAARARGIEIVSMAGLQSTGVGSFQAIILSDVFEHLRRPTSLIRELDKFLVPGGLLIISTGNADVPHCQRDVGSFWYFRNIEHVVMLGREYCENLASELGYRIEEWKTTSHYKTRFVDRVLQHARDMAYWTFRKHERGSALLRWVPVVNRAERWPMPPALTCTADHVVVGLRKQGIDIE